MLTVQAGAEPPNSRMKAAVEVEPLKHPEAEEVGRWHPLGAGAEIAAGRQLPAAGNTDSMLHSSGSHRKQHKDRHRADWQSIGHTEPVERRNQWARPQFLVQESMGLPSTRNCSCCCCRASSCFHDLGRGHNHHTSRG